MLNKFSTLLIIFLLTSHSVNSATIKKDKLSLETKGIVVGSSAVSIGTVAGITISGITAIFPAAVIGGGIGYLTIKAAKRIKNLKVQQKNKN